MIRRRPQAAGATALQVSRASPPLLNRNDNYYEDDNEQAAALSSSTNTICLVICILAVIASVSGVIILALMNRAAAAPAAGGGETTLAPTSLPSALPSVTLLPLCNQLNKDGRCVAVFTYNNPSEEPVVLALGPDTNQIEPTTADGPQLTTFGPGMHYGAAAAVWDCADHDSLTWTLGGRAMSIPATLQTCPGLHA